MKLEMMLVMLMVFVGKVEDVMVMLVMMLVFGGVGDDVEDVEGVG